MDSMGGVLLALIQLGACTDIGQLFDIDQSCFFILNKLYMQGPCAIVLCCLLNLPLTQRLDDLSPVPGAVLGNTSMCQQPPAKQQNKFNCF
jgi:hypothetical protein